MYRIIKATSAVLRAQLMGLSTSVGAARKEVTVVASMWPCPVRICSARPAAAYRRRRDTEGTTDRRVIGAGHLKGSAGLRQWHQRERNESVNASVAFGICLW